MTLLSSRQTAEHDKTHGRLTPALGEATHLNLEVFESRWKLLISLLLQLVLFFTSRLKWIFPSQTFGLAVWDQLFTWRLAESISHPTTKCNACRCTLCGVTIIYDTRCVINPIFVKWAIFKVLSGTPFGSSPAIKKDALPVQAHIDYKMATLWYHCLDTCTYHTCTYHTCLQEDHD